MTVIPFNSAGILIKPAVVQIKDSNEWLNVLNYLGTRRWKDYYDSPICDGQQWSLKVKSGKLNIKSAGSNAYPGGFFKFLSLLNKVTSPTVGYWIK